MGGGAKPATRALPCAGLGDAGGPGAAGPAYGPGGAGSQRWLLRHDPRHPPAAGQCGPHAARAIQRRWEGCPAAAGPGGVWGTALAWGDARGLPPLLSWPPQAAMPSRRTRTWTATPAAWSLSVTSELVHAPSARWGGCCLPHPCTLPSHLPELLPHEMPARRVGPKFPPLPSFLGTELTFLELEQGEDVKQYNISKAAPANSRHASRAQQACRLNPRKPRSSTPALLHMQTLLWRPSARSSWLALRSCTTLLVRVAGCLGLNGVKGRRGGMLPARWYLPCSHNALQQPAARPTAAAVTPNYYVIFQNPVTGARLLPAAAAVAGDAPAVARTTSMRARIPTTCSAPTASTIAPPPVPCSRQCSVHSWARAGSGLRAVGGGQAHAAAPRTPARQDRCAGGWMGAAG